MIAPGRQLGGMTLRSENEYGHQQRRDAHKDAQPCKRRRVQGAAPRLHRDQIERDPCQQPGRQSNGGRRLAEKVDDEINAALERGRCFAMLRAQLLDCLNRLVNLG
jgi:hypothetical protein